MFAMNLPERALDTSPREQPLTRAERFALVVSATSTLGLFYITAAFSLAVLALIVAILFIAMAAAARVGMAGLMRRGLGQHAQLIGLVARSLWLTDGTTYRIPLKRASAPRLFAILDDLCGRAGVPAPFEVFLEMHDNAWVQLKGHRQGTGRMTLGLGYDLLAGLSEGQVRAVLAHEIAHAKLVQRGLSRWLNKGLARLGTLTDQLSGHSIAYRRADYPSQVGELLARWFRALARRAAVQVATYSRQDEFEADRGAAALCGASAMRSALIRLDTLERDLARLPWHERIARVQLGESFSQWLVEEIARKSRAAPEEDVEHAHDPYSTHPYLRDRLGALPPDDGATIAEGSGLALLADPDRIAAELMTEILRVALREEEKDTRRTAREIRKHLGRGNMTTLQGVAAVVMIIAMIVFLFGALDASATEVLIAGAIIALGAAVFWFARYRDRKPLPIPAFGQLTKERAPGETVEQLTAIENEIVAELDARTGSLTKRDARLTLLLDECHAALTVRDYLRAHVAARLALVVDNASTEAQLGYAIAASGLRNDDQAADMLQRLTARVGLRSPNLVWGAAWVLVMIDSWEPAEGLLLRLHKKRPDEPTFLALLALAQYNRNKLQSATLNADRARILDPRNDDLLKLLLGIMISGGQVHRAHAELTSLGARADDDVDHALSWLRVSLIRREFDLARRWAARIAELDVDNKHTIVVGSLFESARLDDDAAAIYGAALEHAYLPAAHVGLARIALHKGNKEEARRRALLALDVEQTVPPKAADPVALFGQVTSILMETEDRRVPCTARTVTVPADAKPFAIAGVTLIVYAPDRAGAESRLQPVISALTPTTTGVDVSTLEWKEAPFERQPVRPVFPAIDTVTAGT
jgi:Zn-dependent protease with chaperone function/tetratricopeptide (TPR) repeat protein